MPEEINEGVRKAVSEEAHKLLQGMRARAPYSGLGSVTDWEGKPRPHLRDALEVRISKDGLHARVGIMGKRKRTQFFFARFLEFGFRPASGPRSRKRSYRLFGRSLGFFKTPKLVKRAFMLPAWLEQRAETRARIKVEADKAFKTVANRSYPDV